MAQFPSTTSASDVWELTDVYRARAGNNWPSVATPSILVGDGVSFPGGTASASSFIDVRTAAKAFDGITADEIYCWHSSGGPTQWLQYDFGTGKTISEYWLMSRPSNDWYPTAWTFAGSNDGSSFTTLDTRSGVVMPAPADGNTSTQESNFVKYTFTNTTAYRYYRWTFTASKPDSSYVVVGEAALIGF